LLHIFLQKVSHYVFFLEFTNKAVCMGAGGVPARGVSGVGVTWAGGLIVLMVVGNTSLLEPWLGVAAMLAGVVLVFATGGVPGDPFGGVLLLLLTWKLLASVICVVFLA
jgi:hypothetical protein